MNLFPIRDLGNPHPLYCVPEQEYFADGITEDITTHLSKIGELFVICRNSAFSYKGKSIRAQLIAEELGVRYLLEGSVRRAANGSASMPS